MIKKYALLIVTSFFLLGYSLTIVGFHYWGKIPFKNPNLYGFSFAAYIVAIVLAALFGHPRGKPVNKI